MPSATTESRSCSVAEILCLNSINWLEEHRNVGAIITSLPDKEETQQSTDDWTEWFINATVKCFQSTSPETATILYQTDRKLEGIWLSKAYLIQKAAEIAQTRLLWHKIVSRRAIGKRDIFRPGYSHLMAFSKSLRSGEATPDLIDRGAVVYPNGTSIQAAETALRFISNTTTQVVDPFCGRGTITALADAHGFKTIGIDIDPNQCSAARKLRFNPKK